MKPSTRLLTALTLMANAITPLAAQQILVNPNGNAAGDVRVFDPGLLGDSPLPNPIISPFELPNSRELWVGNDAAGELLVADGASFTSPTTIIGRNASASGVLTLHGIGSEYISVSGEFTVGGEGAGTLNLLGGATLTNVFDSGSSNPGFRIGVGDRSRGTVVVDGAGSRLDIEAGLLVGVGNQSSADLIVSGGAELDNSTFSLIVGIGDENDSSVTVTGAGSRLIAGNAAVANIGDSGNNSDAALRILDGGQVVFGGLSFGLQVGTSPSDTARGLVVVDGTDSSLTTSTLTLGSRQNADTTGHLLISNGGRVEVQSLNLRATERGNGPVTGSVNITSGGTLHIEGIDLDGAVLPSNLQFRGGTLSFGGDRVYEGGAGDFLNDFDGFLSNRGGALTTSETLSIDGNLNAQSTVTLAGGKLTVGTLTNPSNTDLIRGTLELRDQDVDVTDGGAFGDRLALGFDQRLSIGQTLSVAADGRVDLDSGRLDAGTLENRGLITGNGRLHGALDNRAGGEVRVFGSNDLRISGAPGFNRGEVRVLGSAATIEFDEQFTNALNGEFTNGGTIVADNGLSNAGKLRLLGGAPDVIGDVTNTGTIEVTGSSVATFFGNFDNSGDLVIREGSDAVFFDDLTLDAASTIAFELGAATEQNGLLNVLGDLLLAGSLDIQLTGGYTPAVGDVFAFATIGGDLVGDFGTILQPSGIVFDVNVNASSIDLEVVSLNGLLPGDFDVDGDVDGGDFLVWQRNPGVGNLADWQQNFGSSANPLSSAQAVPEPTTWALFALAAITLIASKPAHRRSGNALRQVSLVH